MSGTLAGLLTSSQTGAPAGSLTDADLQAAPGTNVPPTPQSDMTSGQGTPVLQGSLTDDDLGGGGGLQGSLTDADFGNPAGPYSPDPPKPGMGELFMGGLMHGAAGTASDLDQTITGGAFTDPAAGPPVAPTAVEQQLGRKASEAWSDPRYLAARLGEGLGASAPTVGAGILGATVGGATASPTGPLGTAGGALVGAAGGMALGSFLPELSKAYREARQQNLDPDAAAERAFQLAGLSGVVGGLSGLVGGLGKVFEGGLSAQFQRSLWNAPVVRGAAQDASIAGLAVKQPLVDNAGGRLLASPLGQALVVQPAIGGAHADAAAAIKGEAGPDATESWIDYLINAATGGALAVGHRVATSRPAAPEANTARLPQGTNFNHAPPAPEAPAGPGLPRLPAPGEPQAARSAPAPEPTPPAPAPIAPQPEAGQVAPTPNTPVTSNDPTPVPGPGPSVPGPSQGGSGANDPAVQQPAGSGPRVAGGGGYGGGGEAGAVAPAPNEPGAVPPAPASGEVDGAAPAGAPTGNAGAAGPPADPGGEPGPAAPVGPAGARSGGPGGGTGAAVAGDPAPDGQGTVAPAPRRETVTTHTGRKIDTQFEVVSAAAMKGATGTLQPRDRSSRADSETQIEDIKNRLDPARLGSSPEADRGSPIVGPDDVLETGNGRRAAISRAYAQGLPQADAYRQAIIDQGHTIPEGITDPMLVRRRLTPLDDANRQAFVDEANVDSTKRMSAPEQAKTDARSLSHGLLGRLNPDLKDGVLAAGNAPFVRDWMATVPESQRGDLMQTDGSLSIKGQQRLQGAIIARAYDDKATIERMTESTDDSTKGLSNALSDAAPAIARLRAGVEEGIYGKQYDISPDIVRAAELTKINRDAGQAPRDILTQVDIFNPLPDAVAELVRAYHNDALSRPASRQRVAAVLREYAHLVSETAQGSLAVAGDKAPTPVELLQQARAKAAPDAEKPAQGGLFGPTGTTAATPTPPQDDEDKQPVPEPEAAPAPSPPPEPIAPTPADPATAAQVKKLTAAIKKERDFIATVKGGLPNDPALPKLEAALARKEAQLAKLTGGAAPPKAAPVAADAPVWKKNPGNDNGHTLTLDGHTFQVDRNVGPSSGGAFANYLYVLDPEQRHGSGILTQAPNRAELIDNLRQAIATGGKSMEQYRTAKAASMADAVPPSYRPDVRGNVAGDANFTERPSDHVRAAMVELGVPDPDVALSRPLSIQRLVLRRGLIDKYGLADVVISNRAHPRETVDALADAHQNMQWMAHAMGVPNSAMGLDGSLSLWFGPRNAPEVRIGPGQFALGVYRPGNRTIYMPGRSNSFAHEWTHALDHNLVQALARNPAVTTLLSLSASDWADHPTNTPAGAFGRVMAALFGSDIDRTLTFMRAQERAARAPTAANARELAAARQAYQSSDFYRRAMSIGGPFSTYLSQPYEMLARSHEAYISNRVSDIDGGRTSFIAKSEAAYLSEASRQMQTQYPKGDDRLRIFAAWDQLHDQLRASAIYPQGIPATPPPGDPLGLGGMHWGQWANPAANPALTRRLRAVAQANVAQTTRWAEARARLGITRDGSDPGYLTEWQRTQDSMRIWTHSPRALLNVIHARIPEQARPPIRALIDRLTTDPGSGRHIGRTFEEDVRVSDTHDLNDYAAIAEAAGVVAKIGGFRQAPRLSDADRLAFQQTMVGRTDMNGLSRRLQRAIDENRIHTLPQADQDLIYDHMVTTALPMPNMSPRIARLSAGVRRLLDRKHYELTQAGIEIPYTEGYLPFVMDDQRIWADTEAFRRDAVTVKAMQSRDATQDDGELLRAQFNELRADMDPITVAAIQRELRQSAAARRANPPPAGYVLTAADMVADPALVGAINNAWGVRAAAEWVNAVIAGNALSYETRGPRGDALKERQLPREASDILQRWLVTDPHELVPSYVHQINRKLAYVRRFGQNGEEIDRAINAATIDLPEAQRMRHEDVTEVRRLVNLVTGRAGGNKVPNAAQRMVDRIHAYGTLSVMPRSMITAISEPMTVLLRTGSLRATAAGFVNMLRDAINTGSSQRIAEIANYLGVVADSAFEATQMDRTNANYRGSQHLNTMVLHFFQRSGLTALTNSQRRAALVSSSIFLHNLADTILHHQPSNSRPAPPGGHAAERSLENARTHLRELGIPDNEHVNFARWLSAIDNVPDIAELSDNGMMTPMGELFRTAAIRFINQVNQAPEVSEKPAISNDSMGRLMYSLLGFNYGFMANVTERWLRDAHRQLHNERFAGKLRILPGLVAGAVAGVAAIFFGQLLTRILKESALNGEQWDEHAKEGDLLGWLAEKAWNSTGFNGTLDPVMQAMHSVKYEKSIGSLLLGAYTGHYVDNAQKMLAHWVRPSEHTNTSLYNAYVGAYNLLAVPALSAALTALPGGRLLGAAAGAAMMGSTSQGAADNFATWAAGGPRGTGDVSETPEDPSAAEEARRDKEEADAEKPPKDAGGGVATNAAVALGDDMLPLFGRIAANMPGPLRVGALATGALYGLNRLVNEAERFQGGPAPADKRK